MEVHGQWQPFPPALLKQVWQAVCPPPLRADVDTMSPSARRFPDEWLSVWFTEIGSALDEEKSSAALEFLRQIVLQILKQRASCFISADIAAEYVASVADPASPTTKPVASVQRVLQALVDWGTAASQKSLLLETIRSGPERGRSLEDTIESAFARLRKKRIEILLHPEYARAIALSLGHAELTLADAPQLDPKHRELAQLLDLGIFYELGVVLPQIMWVQTPAIAPGLLAVRINDLLGAPLRGLQPNEWLVNVETNSALLKGYTSRPATNPTTGRAFAIVSGGDRSELDARGLQTWDPVEFIILFASAEIRRQAERFFDVEDAEYQLARLETAFPALVHLALERFSVGTITRVLRGLLADQNSVRNLRLILERMLQFEMIRADSQKLIVFDDRFTVPMEQPVGSPPGWSELLEFAQSGLKFYLAHKLTRGQNSLPVLLVSPAVEERLGKAWPALDAEALAPLTAVEEQALLNEVWQNLPDLDGNGPAILIKPSVRYPMRQILRSELPELPVITYTQLSPDVSLKPLARLESAIALAHFALREIPSRSSRESRYLGPNGDRRLRTAPGISAPRSTARFAPGGRLLKPETAPGK